MYFVTYQPSAQVERVAHAVNTVNTTDSSVIISDIEQTIEYTISVDVGTAGGKLRSLHDLGAFNNGITPGLLICYRCELPFELYTYIYLCQAKYKCLFYNQSMTMYKLS